MNETPRTLFSWGVSVALFGGLIACATVTDAPPSTGTSASALSSGVPVYLRASGSTLFLDRAAPTATTPAQKDSAGVHLSGGNPWIEVGAWSSTSIAQGTLTSLGAAELWIGLKNSDDIGTNFDVRAEVYDNATLIASGEVLCVTGVTRNAAQAKAISIPFSSFSPVPFTSADTLSLRIVTRIGTNGAGASCGGHASAVGLRTYFDALSRPAAFATIAPASIACTTRITDYFTGEPIETIEEADVPVQQGATPSLLIFQSAGWRHAMYNTDITLVSAFPTAEPALYYGHLEYGGVPGPSTLIQITRFGDQATLSGFVHHARPFLTRFVTFSCATGTTTIRPATP